MKIPIRREITQKFCRPLAGQRVTPDARADKLEISRPGELYGTQTTKAGRI